LGGDLLNAIEALAKDFYSSEAVHEVADLAEMGDRAAAEFRERHPEIAEDAVDALRWCYTFDNR
jgi:hypothetical protein